MRRTFLCLTLAVLSLAACGDDPTGPATLDIVGSYDGTWTHTVEGSGLETTTEVCAGNVTIIEQLGGLFEGTFSQTASENCDAGTGVVSGSVTADGALTVQLDASGGGGRAFEESTGCTIISVDRAYSGIYENGAMTFETNLTARCPETGSTDVIFTYTFDSP